MTRCPSCGAAQPERASCRECFDALLAYENERPEVFFAVHHLTVAAYFLQHPETYAPATLDAWRGLIAEALDKGTPPRELMKRIGRQFAGGRKAVKTDAAPPDDWPRAWPMTVVDVLDPRDALPDDDVYVERARRWASSVRHTLDTR